MHELQKKIVLQLIHKPKASFSELVGEREDTNNVAYHLKTLKEQGLIDQEDGLYKLSLEGRRISAFIEGDSGEKAQFPTFAHGLIIRDGDKILVQKRLKEPFYGLWSLISGKINFGFNVEACALRDLSEETGLVANRASMVGINQIKTYEGGKLAYHHVIFFVRVDGISGNLVSTTHKAENRWMSIEEFKNAHRMPDPWLDDVLECKSFILLQTERELVDGVFRSCFIVDHKVL